MEALKHGSKYKEPVPPKIYDIVCKRCGCEYRVEDPEEGKIENKESCRLHVKHGREGGKLDASGVNYPSLV